MSHFDALTRSGVSAGLRESFAIFCVRVHASDVSDWLPSHPGSSVRGFVSLAGKCGFTDVTDTCSGVAFELIARFCVHACVSGASIFPWAFLAPPCAILCI